MKDCISQLFTVSYFQVWKLALTEAVKPAVSCSHQMGAVCTKPFCIHARADVGPTRPRATMTSPIDSTPKQNQDENGNTYTLTKPQMEEKGVLPDDCKPRDHSKPSNEILTSYIHSSTDDLHESDDLPDVA